MSGLASERIKELWRGVWVIAYREFLRFFRERSRLIAFLVWPLALLLVLGVGFNRIIGVLTPGVDYIRFVVPGVIAINVATSSLASGLSVVWDREFGFLREVLVAPISRSGIVLGKAVGGAAVALIQGLVLLLFAPVLGAPISPALALKLMPSLASLALCSGVLGVLIASRLRSMRAFGVARQLVQFPVVFLSGAFFPLDIMPAWLQVISKLNPATYGVDAVRQVFLGKETLMGSALQGGGATLGVSVLGHSMGVLEDLLVLAGLGIALLAAAAWSFSRQE